MQVFRYTKMSPDCLSAIPSLKGTKDDFLKSKIHFVYKAV